MKKILKNIIIISSALIIVFLGTIAFTEPGSATDPLVTLSYVDKRIEQLKNYIDQKLTGTTPKEEGAWVVVEVPEGKSLICNGGTEIILRAGTAKAISSIKEGVENGLTDITAGKDLKMDEGILQNHLLIIPRTDGRGAYSVNHTFWLVKGSYEIK